MQSSSSTRRCQRVPLHPLGRIEDDGKVSDLERRGCKLAVILSIPYMWFTSGGAKIGVTSFGVGLQAEQVIITPGVSESTVHRFACKRPISVLQADDEAAQDTAGDAAGDAGDASAAYIPLGGDETNSADRPHLALQPRFQVHSSA